MYTTQEAARELGVSTRRIRQACLRDQVGQKIGRDWFLDDVDILYLRQRKGQHGKKEQ